MVPELPNLQFELFSGTDVSNDIARAVVKHD